MCRSIIRSYISEYDHATVYISSSFFFYNNPSPTEIYTLSLHDALPISIARVVTLETKEQPMNTAETPTDTIPDDLKADLQRSEEHTSELQSLAYLVCRLLLEKKKKSSTTTLIY